MAGDADEATEADEGDLTLADQLIAGVATDAEKRRRLGNSQEVATAFPLSAIRLGWLFK